MRFGMNLLLWTAHVEERHHPLLAELKELGFDGVEIPIGRGDAAHYRALGRELDRLELARTAITSPTPETNPVSPDPAVRRAAVERLRWVVDMATELGAEALFGPVHSAFKEFTGAPPTPDERRWSAEVLREGAEHAELAGLRIGIEALNRFECYLVNTMADARAIVDAVDHPALGIHYDTHHMHIEEKDPAAAVRRAGDRLFHVHVSDSDRGVPGRGQVRFAETFAALRALGYDDWLVIEAFSRSDPDFANAIHVWRDYDPADEIPREGLAFLRRAWAESAG